MMSKMDRRAVIGDMFDEGEVGWYVLIVQESLLVIEDRD